MKSPEAAEADVCLLVEGTYPFVSGGVSSWVHDIILGHPELRFAVLNVGSHPGAYGEPRFKLPDNVVGLHRVFCQDAARPPLDGAARADLREEIRTLRAADDTLARPSRVLAGMRRLHLEDPSEPEALRTVLADLASNDLTLEEFLYGHASFDLLTALADRTAAEAPFLDLFWHYRAIHVPMLRLLAAPVVPAACYHAIATGYAGLLAAVWSQRTRRPLALTEHGIYAREREMELARADWIRDVAETDDGGFGLRTATWAPHISPLRKIWSRFFRTLSRLAYAQAGRIVTLSEVNRGKQIADGAPPAKIDIVPNGVDLPDDPPLLEAVAEEVADERAGDGGAGVIVLRSPPLRVGFVGRVVPIKDLITFIRACDLALRSVELEVRVIGPMEEDPAYATRCRDLVARFGRAEQIAFVGPMKPADIYPSLDVVVLTSFSEGQPLVILEAYARGVPVIASDVGACREMIEGRDAADRALGPSGFVTRVATPKETAAALIKLARDPALRQRLGVAGFRRVSAYYQRRDMLASYRALYASMGADGAGGQEDRVDGAGLSPAESVAGGAGTLSGSPGKSMAGIGWKLQRLIDRGSLAGTIGAYLTGVAVTSAPWLLTTAVLTSLRVVARHSGTDFSLVERFLTVVYAVTVIFSAPVHVVVSRYTADRLYDHRLEKIGAPLRRATALTLAGFAICGVLIVVLMKLPLPMAVVGAPLCAIVGAQWLMLSVGGGMTSPVIVLRAFGFGAPFALVAAWTLDTTFHLGSVGYLYGFAFGQLATLAILVQGVARAVPGDADESARLLPAFREYRLLALSALAYYVSIWADKIVVWLVQGGDAATFYAAIAAVAWFSVIPAFAWIYVQIETTFYRRFRAFYADIEIGAPLKRLQQGAEEISVEARRILRGAGLVQASATGIAIAAAPLLVHAVGLSPNATPLFRLNAIGAAAQMITLLEVLLLYYFDLRRDALVISTGLLCGEVALTLVALALGWPPVIGYLIACAATSAMGAILVRRRLSTLVLDTFASQPFGVS